ncbi:MAG TPA: sigma-54 dependent transcriptional regulator [Thiobacillus sp.]|nr:sigma-54 dependent transcriptional regulator [Thiobacillus sp.]HQT68852.1 sigma-54 dependent transcriptional regulator [Thiobacillus sp.]
MTKRQVVLLAKNDLYSQMQGLLSASGWQPLQTVEFEIAKSLGADHNIHVGLMDLSDASPAGIDHIEALTASNHGMEWIALVTPVMLSNPALCRLLKLRFHDFHTLPVDASRLLASLGHAHGKARLTVADALPADAQGKYGMIGTSKVMRELYTLIDKTHSVDAPVLIDGESGTGKELVAHAIHQVSSRADAPFVAVNCAALPANLIQSELFGHEKGAFTGAQQRKIGRLEAAVGGTIFLDEIGDLPLDLQVNLLRVLQNRSIQRLGSHQEIQLDVRVVAASNVNLELAVKQGRFREDLYYRLNVLRLHTPPLREREGDVPLLAQHYFQAFADAAQGNARGFSQQTLRVMSNYAWPGNVRELINRVRRAVIMSEHPLLKPGDLGLEKRAVDAGSVTLDQARAQAEFQAIRCALRRNQNNMSAAARQLGISRATLYRVLERSAGIATESRLDPAA